MNSCAYIKTTEWKWLKQKFLLAKAVNQDFSYLLLDNSINVKLTTKLAIAGPSHLSPTTTIGATNTMSVATR